MTTIKEKAEELAPYTREDSWNKIQKCIIAQTSFEAGAKYVLEEIENLVKTTIGEGETYHYNLYMGLQKLVKELKGE